MKPAIIFVAAFVVATAAASGARFAMTKPGGALQTAADSTRAHADSTRIDTALVASGEAHAIPDDTARRAAVLPDSAAPTVASAVAVGEVRQAGAPMSGPAGPVRAPAPQSDSVRRASEQRLAKVFTSMDPKQAAKVLEHMSDNDAQIILGYVSPRQAAAIMTALPPERVAALSKLAMDGNLP